MKNLIIKDETTNTRRLQKSTLGPSTMFETISLSLHMLFFVSRFQQLRKFSEKMLYTRGLLSRNGILGTRTFTAVSDRTSSVRSLICEEFGEPEVMKIGTKELPALGEGQVLVKMKAAGVNPSDT